jgi:hypothetical protein
LTVSFHSATATSEEPAAQAVQSLQRFRLEDRMAKRKRAAKRELIDTKRGGKRYTRRTAAGRFKESDQVSKALPRDRRQRATTKAKRGQGDRGDR